MNWGIIIFLLIILVAILLRARRRPSWRHAPQTPQQAPQGGATPAPVYSGQRQKTSRSLAFVLTTLGVLVIIFCFWFLLGVGGIVKYLFFTPSSPATSSSGPVVVTDVLVLVGECVMPCSLPIPEGRFKVRTDGDPFRAKFKGVGHWVDYPGKGDFHAPDGVEVGEAQFASRDEKNLHVRVQVYRIVTVRR